MWNEEEQMKGLMRASYGGSAMWREIGLPKESYVGDCAGRRSVGRPRKRWIDTVMEYLKKRGLDIRQARRMVQDRSEWWGKCMGRSPWDEPLTLTRCHSCGFPQLYEVFEGWNSVCGRAYNLRGNCFYSLLL